jgi:lipopolysaccharide export system permease protein
VRLLDLYVARQFIATFLMLVLGLPMLFVVTDITDQLDKYLARGVGLADVAISYVYYLPQFVFWSLPIAALVATVFTIGNMTRHQEIAAAKAGGVSFYRLIVPVVVLAASLSVAAVAIGELVPTTNRKRAEALGEQVQSVSSLRTNFVFQTEGGRILSVRRLDAERQRMTNVVLERPATEEELGVHQTAAEALWSVTDGWVFNNGYLRILGPDGGEASFAYEKLRVPDFGETPEELLAEPKDPEEMRYAEVGRFVKAVERSGGDARSLQVEQAQKISLPMAIFVIVLFGAPLSTSSRRGGTAFGIGISLLITMIYLMLFKVGEAIGTSGSLDPLVAAWLPNALFLAGGLYLLRRVRT